LKGGKHGKATKCCPIENWKGEKKTNVPLKKWWEGGGEAPKGIGGGGSNQKRRILFDTAEPLQTETPKTKQK